jgi:hypothetical protein
MQELEPLHCLLYLDLLHGLWAAWGRVGRRGGFAVHGGESKAAASSKALAAAAIDKSRSLPCGSQRASGAARRAGSRVKGWNGSDAELDGGACENVGHGNTRR